MESRNLEKQVSGSLEVDEMMLRVDKWISDTTGYSRSEVKTFFKYRQVKLNGTIIQSSSIKANPEKDVLTLKDEELVYEKEIYLMLNKPKGVITATEDKMHETVIDLIDSKYRKRVFPIGRLDKDTEGLLLLTSDGQYSHQLMHPKKKVSKIYFVEVDRDLSSNLVDEFSKGVDILDYVTKPGNLEILDSRTCTLEIFEGKFHQVKRMFEAFEYDVIYLKRIQIGQLKLDESLEVGCYRKLEKHEIKQSKTLQE